MKELRLVIRRAALRRLLGVLAGASACLLWVGSAAMAFELASPAFRPDRTIPTKYTCDGPDLSVPLSWRDIPTGAKSFALVADDPDAPGGTWVHWVVYDLPADARELPEGVPPGDRLANGAAQGINDFGKIGYGGPCPPRGPEHRYFFTLYALDGKTGLAPGAAKRRLLEAIKGRILGEARLVGRYRR